MSENKLLSDRFKSYVYSTHPVMLSASELFRYADEIAALEQRLAEAGWQPIETAPIDEPILLSKMHPELSGEWFWIVSGLVNEDGSIWVDFVDDDRPAKLFHAPTHWMPLPPHPRRTAMTDELKPCPFCGGECELHTYGRTIIWCPSCEYSFSNGRCIANNVKAWNTRHTPDVQAAIDAALEKLNATPQVPDGMVNVPAEYARVAGKILSGEMSLMVNDKTTKIGRTLIAAAKEEG